jgi:hypothetical protein
LSRIKLAYALPAAQVSLAVGLLLIARHSHPPVQVDTIWESTAELLCTGLNTPADRLALILLEVLPWPAGMFWGDLLFLVLVAALWYLIGKEIDLLWNRIDGIERQISPGRILGNLLAALFGVYLLLIICFHNMFFTDPRNGSLQTANGLGDLLRQSLWFLWSLILILIPCFTLIRALRRGPPGRGSALRETSGR